jgi:hypothetical protein
VSRLLSSLCIRGAGAGHASDRAALLRFLLDKGYQMDLTSVNARLETPLHCALRSRSLEILEVSPNAPSLSANIAEIFFLSTPYNQGLQCCRLVGLLDLQICAKLLWHEECAT